MTSPEQFGIYLNYVRKLGFEETPDYDFLRELFTKVLQSSGEPEDGVYDWMMLNGGKGWEVSSSTSNLLAQANNHQSGAAGDDRRHRSQRGDRERAERHALRASQAALASTAAAGGPIPPSPALVRHGSKQGRKSGVPGVLSSTTNSHNGSSPTPKRQSAAQQLQAQQQHPYATTTGAIISPSEAALARGAAADDFSATPNYMRSAANSSSQGPLASPAMLVRGAESGQGTARRPGQQTGGADFMDGHGERKTFGQKFADLLACRCS